MCCPYKNDLNLIKRKQKNDHLRLHQCKSFCKCKPFHKIKSVGKNFIKYNLLFGLKGNKQASRKIKIKIFAIYKKVHECELWTRVNLSRGIFTFQPENVDGRSPRPSEEIKLKNYQINSQINLTFGHYLSVFRFSVFS